MKRKVLSLALVAIMAFSIYAFAVGGTARSAQGAQSGANTYNEAGGITVSSLAGASASYAAPYNIGTPKVVDIWVDAVRGSDSDSGATRAMALATLEAAWNRIPERTTLTTTGYRIMLCAGSYRERMPPNGWMESRYGTYQCPVIIQSADGVGAARLSNVDMFNCRYTYLIGVRIEASGAENDNALHLGGCNHILVQQVQVVGTGDIYAYTSPKEALKANQCQYVYIEDSDLSGGWDNALNCVAVQYGHVIHNRIHRALEWCICLKGGSASLLVEGNEIYDSGVGGFTAGQGAGFEWMVSPWLHYEAYDLKFINNVIHDIEGPSGMGVNGGYNILLAYNTLYRVGRTDNTMEFVHGLRGCDGENIAACAANLKAGGWGTVRTGWENKQPIPSRNVFVYNNIVYNPPGYQSQSSQFWFEAPQTPASDSNIPSPSRADTNLQIRGNIIWNGPSDVPLVGEYQYIPSTPTCNATQLVRDNAINTLQPQLVDPAHGNFRPVQGGNVFAATVFPIPRFPGGDRPQPPLAPQGDLSNTVTYDYNGMPRTSLSPPGAFTETVKKPTTFTVATSIVTPTTNVAFTLFGTLKSGTTPLTGQPVHLERRTYTSGAWGAWANVANTYKYTNATGMIKLSQTVATAGKYQYRWHFNGSTSYAAAYSSALTETAKRPATITITASNEIPTTNTAFFLTGRLTSRVTPLLTLVLPFQPVHLERRSFSSGAWGAWANVANTYKYTNATGVIKLSQTVATTGTFQYRWHFNGTTTYQPVYSPAVTEMVKKPTSMTITATPSTPAYNTAFKLSGTLKSGTTGLSGLSVYLERKIGTGAWTAVTGTTRTTSAGGVIPPVFQTMTQHNTYSYRWHFWGTETYQPCYSPVKTFTV